MTDFDGFVIYYLFRVLYLKVITYASGKDADFVIWVVKKGKTRTQGCNRVAE